ncbi:hypothetical protein [Brevibacterium antiquum]|uniref:hypothetical protein n=1 Tax=Brevibacterium antiquum TaxID=234835 RepID=UPI000C759801|nr:hypothetical protein [Brevibacterium antiquum]
MRDARGVRFAGSADGSDVRELEAVADAGLRRRGDLHSAVVILAGSGDGAVLRSAVGEDPQVGIAVDGVDRGALLGVGVLDVRLENVGGDLAVAVGVEFDSVFADPRALVAVVGRAARRR